MTAKSLYKFLEVHLSKFSELEKEQLCELILYRDSEQKSQSGRKSDRQKVNSYLKGLMGTTFKSGF